MPSYRTQTMNLKPLNNSEVETKTDYVEPEVVDHVREKYNVEIEQ